jgi:hypothetical protein
MTGLDGRLSADPPPYAAPGANLRHERLVPQRDAPIRHPVKGNTLHAALSRQGTLARPSCAAFTGGHCDSLSWLEPVRAR